MPDITNIPLISIIKISGCHILTFHMRINDTMTHIYRFNMFDIIDINVIVS